jgi:hypothetical protein
MFKSNMDLTDDEVQQHAEADRRESIRRSKWSKWSPPAELLSQTKGGVGLVFLGGYSAGLLILVVGLAGAGLIFQAVATRNDQQEFPPPGELVDIDGYELHINCIGEGSPTIILDALASGSSASWGLVQPEIAQSTRVCGYDRAGAGWSARGPIPA